VKKVEQKYRNFGSTPLFRKVEQKYRNFGSTFSKGGVEWKNLILK
jgi:hypothetical protein